MSFAMPIDTEKILRDEIDDCEPSNSDADVYRLIKRGIVDETGPVYFSLQWICRQPKKACSLLLRHPGTLANFAIRQPGKFFLVRNWKSHAIQASALKRLRRGLSKPAEQVFQDLKEALCQRPGGAEKILTMPANSSVQIRHNAHRR